MCFDFRRGRGKKKRGLAIQSPMLLSIAPDLHLLNSSRVGPNSTLLWERQVLNLYQLQKHFRFLISFLIAIQGIVWFVPRPAFAHLFWRLKMSQRVQSNQCLKKNMFVDTQVCYCSSNEKIMLSLYLLSLDGQLKLGCWIAWYMVQQ